MNTRSFASDNNAGIHPDILKAIEAANNGHVIAYGDDTYTEKAIAEFKKLLGNDIEVFFVFGGTAANVLGIKTATESFNAVICAETAHINVDECGAPEKFTGCKLLPIPTMNGKITVEQIAHHVHGIGDQHHVQAKVVSITQATEMGTLYTTKEIKAIADYAHQNNMFLHMDGARIANAVVGLDVDIKEITKNAGVDILSFGGTKNGMMFGEAVIFFNQKLAKDFRFIRKQGMQLASKMRFVSAQFAALFANDLWIQNAKHANKMACLLANKIKEIPQVKITQEVQANAVFAIVPKQSIPKLQEKYFFYVWNEETSEVRWMASFDTQEEDIENFVKFVKEMVK
ncbi:low specificity L-threonine aldolase [Candidatus Parcubacteria bacterium]|nr:low specificity L-threonine aldolase [Candidatus Parcubacteria bacterium]